MSENLARTPAYHPIIPHLRICCACAYQIDKRIISLTITLIYELSINPSFIVFLSINDQVKKLFITHGHGRNCIVSICLTSQKLVIKDEAVWDNFFTFVLLSSFYLQNILTILITCHPAPANSRRPKAQSNNMSIFHLFIYQTYILAYICMRLVIVQFSDLWKYL